MKHIIIIFLYLFWNDLYISFITIIYNILVALEISLRLEKDVGISSINLQPVYQNDQFRDLFSTWWTHIKKLFIMEIVLNYYKSNFQKKTIYLHTLSPEWKIPNFSIWIYVHNLLISLIPWKEKFACIFHQNQCSWFFRNACKKKKKLHKILLPFFNQSINQFPFHFKTFDKIVSFFPRTFCAEERRNITKIIIDQSHAIHVFHAFSASADYCRG